MHQKNKIEVSVAIFVFYGAFTGRFFSLSEELQIILVCLEVKFFEIFIIINKIFQFTSIPVTFSHGIFINSYTTP